MLNRADGRCELTGVLFEYTVRPGVRARPLIPSLDRIDPQKGYIKENLRVVCYAVNAAINEWGDGVFEIIARGYRGTKRKRNNRAA